MDSTKKPIGLLAVVLALSLNAPAFAQVPVIEDISKNGFNVIRHLSRVEEPVLSLQSAEKIKRAVLANEVLDDGEKRMLQYLIDEQSFTIRVPTSTVDAVQSKPVSAEAKALFRSLQTTVPGATEPIQIVPEIDAKVAAFTALHEIAEAGDAEAQFELAQLYGNGRERDYYSVDKSIHWLKKASAQGHAGAQYELAGEYSYGRHIDGSGLDRSSAKSFELYTKAANQGHAGAMMQIGQAYQYGEGSVGISPEQAAVWYKKSADLGDHWGMFYLAVQYLEGNGVPQSKDKAIVWLKKSYALGNENAEDELWDMGEID